MIDIDNPNNWVFCKGSMLPWKPYPNPLPHWKSRDFYLDHHGFLFIKGIDLGFKPNLLKLLKDRLAAEGV